MRVALDEARAAVEHDDVPVGAVVARSETGEILARRHNERELTGDPTAHAELLALRDAAGVAGRWRLDDCVLVITLEPCPMCAGAAWASRIAAIVFGAADPKAGAAGSLYNLAVDQRLNHTAEVVTGIESEACAAILRDFFSSKRSEA